MITIESSVYVQTQHGERNTAYLTYAQFRIVIQAYFPTMPGKTQRSHFGNARQLKPEFFNFMKRSGF